MRSRLVIVAVAIAALCSFGQQPAATSASIAATVAAEFGPNFKVDPEFGPLSGDFDGDAIDDLAVVVMGVNPLGAAEHYGYKVIDPYDAYFGWGNPRITMQFETTEGKAPRYLLIIHNGADGKVKAKFLIINLPFRRLSAVSSSLKKKHITALATEDQGGLGALVFWDGRKYRWEPMQIAAE